MAKRVAGVPPDLSDIMGKQVSVLAGFRKGDKSKLDIVYIVSSLKFLYFHVLMYVYPSLQIDSLMYLCIKHIAINYISTLYTHPATW